MKMAEMLIPKANLGVLMPAMKNSRGRNNTDSRCSYFSFAIFENVFLENFTTLHKSLAGNGVFFMNFYKKINFFWIALIFSLKLSAGCRVVYAIDL
jgi:hypothetical protein